MRHKIEIDSIVLEIGQRCILSDVYLQCETGNITALLGRNGQGKTCLFNGIYGISNVESKSVRVDNKFIEYPYLHSEIITYLPQNNFIPKSLSAKNVFADFDINYSDLEVDLPELVPFYRLPIKKLSGGQRRLLEIYVIIKARSYFSLLDEPFTYLSPIHMQQITALILQERKNKGFIITDHLYKEVIDISDSLYVLENGKTHLVKSKGDIEKFGYVTS